jgi:methionyl-tRNA formyltransferase
MNKLRIALLCNNKIAMPALQRLATEGVLCGIATADKDAGIVTIYKQLAAGYNVPYLKITRKNYTAQLEEWLRATQPDIVFVMTFPWRLPAALLQIPAKGFLNFHYGLLPGMRGADPIFESIRQRLPTVGLAVHVMDEGLDTGPVVLQEEIVLPGEYTYGMVSNQVALIGEKMCASVIKKLNAGDDISGIPQDEATAKYWPKIGESGITIRYRDMDSKTIMALVRACNPVALGTPSTINGWKVGICDVSEVNLQGASDAIVPGTIVALDVQNGMIVYCKDGQGLKLDVVYTAEGVFPGYKLAFFGIGQGMVFD